MAKIRLFFSGMCLNILNGTTADKSRADSLDVVMLDGISKDGLGFRHYPALAVPQSHLMPGTVVDRIIATRTAQGDAQYYGVIGLAGFDCRLEVTAPGTSGLRLNQTPLPEGGRPTTDDEWGSLQLVADPARATNTALTPIAGLVTPDAAGMRHHAVQSTFHLSAGLFGAAKPSVKYQSERWRFYPGLAMQVFADSTVLTLETDTPVTLIGTGFGDRRGRTFAISLGREQKPEGTRDADVFVSNVPVQQLPGYDRNDFLPFGEALTPQVTIPPHQHEVGGDPVYCMSAISYN